MRDLEREVHVEQTELHLLNEKRDNATRGREACKSRLASIDMLLASLVGETEQLNQSMEELGAGGKLSARELASLDQRLKDNNKMFLNLNKRIEQLEGVLCLPEPLSLHSLPLAISCPLLPTVNFFCFFCFYLSHGHVLGGV